MVVYLGDLGVRYETSGKKMKYLISVLQRTKEARLRMNQGKFYTWVRSVEILWNRESFGEIIPSDDHKEVLTLFR